jgi:hypothetical protein
MKRWTVDPCGDYGPLHSDAGDVQTYLAPTAKDAAQMWADERGHDVDDAPVVKVSGEGFPDAFFELHAKVKWYAKRVE